MHSLAIDAFAHLVFGKPYHPPFGWLLNFDAKTRKYLHSHLSSHMNLLKTDSDAQRLVLSFLPVEERLATRTVCRDWSLLVNPRERRLRLERMQERFGTLQEALRQAVRSPTDAVRSCCHELIFL